MLSQLRHIFIDSWLGRILVGVVFIVFVGWGVGDIYQNLGQQNENVVAWVGKKEITTEDLGSASKRELARLMSQRGISDPSQISPMIKGQLVNEVLQQLITQSIFLNQAHKAGITVSDEAIRNMVFGLPYLQKDGKFDRSLLEALLRANQISEDTYLNSVRDDLASGALMMPLQDGGIAPEILVKSFFDFNNQTRTVSYVTIPFDQFKPDTTPSDAVLKRYYDNHPWQFIVPEFRRARFVILSPQTIAKDLQVSDDDAKHYYEASKSRFQKTEQRTIQMLSFKDQKEAQEFVSQWKPDLSWQDVQNLAKGHASAIEIPDINKGTIPGQLGNDVFTAQLNSVSAPMKRDSDWVIFKVVHVTPADSKPFDTVKDQLKQEIAESQASQLMGERVAKIQDVLAGGNGLDGIPGGLGVAAIEGTLNEQGMTQEGEHAPMPAEGQFKKMLLEKIFSTGKGVQPSLMQGSNNSYYALTVENIIPEHQETFEQAKDKVLKAWQEANIYRQANIAATDVFRKTATVKDGVQGVNGTFPVSTSNAFSRSNPDPKISPKLQQNAFMMKLNQSMMIQTPTGFVVATLIHKEIPKVSEQPENYKRIKESLTQEIDNDILLSYGQYMQKADLSSVNKRALDAVVNQIAHQ